MYKLKEAGSCASEPEAHGYDFFDIRIADMNELAKSIKHNRSDIINSTAAP